mgnify:CR=1 FL=1
MLKVGLLCGVIAAMSATGIKATLQDRFESKPCDARFIIELEDDIENISAEKAIKQQDALYRKIVNSVNKNAKKDQNLSLITNAVVVSANKEDIDAIKELPGVKYVTENASRIVKKSGNGGMTFDLKAYREGGGAEPIDLSQNASAKTMNLPDDESNKKGEGTLIAVLDNEFYLRGKYKDENGVTKDAYNHVAFTKLDSGVKERLTADDVKNLSGLHATEEREITSRGYEGSLYFNSKVPFYYDYAGDSYTGSSYGAKPDFNVESTVDLHGSHVASIAAGNDPDYKGIAPKAQLALMKVFTDVHSTPISQSANMGSYGSFNELGFINALEDCIKLKVDAINVSIGSDLADFEEGTISQRMLQKISDANILSAISAGNAGKASYAFTGGYGYWTRDVVETGIFGSFANNASTMSIAAGQPEWTFYENSLKLGDDVVPFDDQIVNNGSSNYKQEHKLHELVQDIPDPDVDPTPAEQERDIEYVYTKGFGAGTDYDKLPTDYKDVYGKVVVVNRGKTNFSDKLDQAVARGAAGLIIINNDPTETTFNFRCDFGTDSVDIPVAICLYRDKPFFDANPYGKFKIKKNTASVNNLAYTVSDFSSDGPTYDLDLKPEITTPGSNIKGAVWPQNKKELNEHKYDAYEYFDGTSMAAPNYEGAMAVLLSKITAGSYTKAQLEEFKKSVDMRFMSTADPMTDKAENGENHELTLTSPRLQGAGMANIGKALATDVYLEGSDSDGSKINKSKILLRNNDDIKNGKVKLSFTIHNDGASAHTYNVKYNVMRPATELCNKVLTKDYHAAVEVSSVKEIPGFQFFSPEEEKVIYQDGRASYKDVIKVSRDIPYFTSAEAYASGVEDASLKEGMYYCADENPDWTKGIAWESVPPSIYQSIKDIEIATVSCDPITVNAGESKDITLKEFELSAEQKAKIAELYEAGTYIEGYVSLEAQDSSPSLSMPYMGFYSLTDMDSSRSYSSPKAVEEFDFEKDPNKIYASDLVNDVTKSLLGKDNVDFGSMMVAGYTKNPENIDINKVLTNDRSFKTLTTDGTFYNVGTRPTASGEEYGENPADEIYLGNPAKSNTLVIQQFVLRSIKDNYFTITSKGENQRVVFKSAMEDMLFGDTFGKYALYKSHVDGNYLGGGYVAHRAYAIVPLYDLTTKEPFESGEYELKFNYQLVGTNEWVSKSYTLHIDSETPVVSSIAQYKDNDNKDMVRITFKDMRMAYAKLGSNKVDVSYDEVKKVYYADVEKSMIDNLVGSRDVKKTSFSDTRLFITAVDYARGETTAIVHFNGDDYGNFTLVQGQGFTINTDFKYENEKLTFIELQNDGSEKEFVPMYKTVLVNGVPGEIKYEEDNLGLVIGLSAGGGVLVLGGVGVLLYFLVFKKKKPLGGM